VPFCEGVLLERGRQKEVPPKRLSFAVIGSSSVKTVVDRYRHVAYYNKHRSCNFLVLSTSITLNDFDSPEIRGFRELFVISGCDTHFKSKLRQKGLKLT